MTVFLTEGQTHTEAEDLFRMVWEDCRGTFNALMFMSASFWLVTSSLWYGAEHYFTPWMTSLPATLYFTCIFLVGEWHFADFASPFGQIMCMLYCIFGVGIFALPIGLVTDSLCYHLEQAANQESEGSDAASGVEFDSQQRRSTRASAGRLRASSTMGSKQA